MGKERVASRAKLKAKRKMRCTLVMVTGRLHLENQFAENETEMCFETGASMTSLAFSLQMAFATKISK